MCIFYWKCIICKVPHCFFFFVSVDSIAAWGESRALHSKSPLQNNIRGNVRYIWQIRSHSPNPDVRNLFFHLSEFLYIFMFFSLYWFFCFVLVETLRTLEVQPLSSTRTFSTPRMLAITCPVSTFAIVTWSFCTINRTRHSNGWMSTRNRKSWTTSSQSTTSAPMTSRSSASYPLSIIVDHPKANQKLIIIIINQIIIINIKIGTHFFVYLYKWKCGLIKTK